VFKKGTHNNRFKLECEDGKFGGTSRSSAIKKSQKLCLGPFSRISSIWSHFDYHSELHCPHEGIFFGKTLRLLRHKKLERHSLKIFYGGEKTVLHRGGHWERGWCKKMLSEQRPTVKAKKKKKSKCIKAKDWGGTAVALRMERNVCLNYWNRGVVTFTRQAMLRWNPAKKVETEGEESLLRPLCLANLKRRSWE